jgi:tetratricopeptide (TPR) repeat protein
MMGNVARAEELAETTAKLARHFQDDRSLFEILVNKFLGPRAGFSRDEMRERRSLVDEMTGIAERLGDRELMSRALSTDFYFSAECGESEQLSTLLAKLVSVAEQGQRRLIQWVAGQAKVLLAILEGDLAGAERLADTAFTIGQKTGGQVEGVYGLQLFTIRREQARLAEVAPIIKRFTDDHPEEAAWRPGFALIACDLGFKEAAQRTLAQIAETGFTFALDAKRSTTLAFLAEVCASLKDESRAEELYGKLKAYRDMTITAGVATVCYGSAGRYLGLLADTLGEWDKSEEHFEEALKLNRDMKAWPWLAHTQQEFARMWHRRGRKSDIVRADELLHEAWATAERLHLTALSSRLRSQQN